MATKIRKRRIVVGQAIYVAIVNVVAARARRDSAARTITKNNEILLPWFLETFKDTEDGEDRSITIEADNAVIRSTLVTPGSEVLDETKLRELIGEVAWKRLLTPTFDKDKLVKAVQAGKIDQETLDACMSRVNTAPYVKHTVTTR